MTISVDLKLQLCTGGTDTGACCASICISVDLQLLLCTGGIDTGACCALICISLDLKLQLCTGGIDTGACCASICSRREEMSMSGISEDTTGCSHHSLAVGARYTDGLGVGGSGVEVIKFTEESCS